MTFFLRLKHWQLFLMLTTPTLACLASGVSIGPFAAASIGFLMMLALFGWMFALGSWSNQQLPESRRGGTRLFGAALLTPLIYALMYIILVIPELASATPPSRPPLWMMPIHMLSMTGIFYGIWFTARKFKSLLENEDASFLIFSSTFFLLFVFPLGVWVIQPSVNRLYQKHCELAVAEEPSAITEKPSAITGEPSAVKEDPIE